MNSKVCGLVWNGSFPSFTSISLCSSLNVHFSAVLNPGSNTCYGLHSSGMAYHTLMENYRTTYHARVVWRPGEGYHWCLCSDRERQWEYSEMKMLSIGSQSIDQYTFRIKIGSCRGVSTVEEVHTFHILKLAPNVLCSMPFGKSLWASILWYGTGYWFPVRKDLKDKVDTGSYQPTDPTLTTSLPYAAHSL